MRNSVAILKHEVRIMRTDVETPMFMILMPLLMMAFMKPLFRLALMSEGYSRATGAEHAVPGIAVMFSSFFVGYMGFAFLREHGWGTWERLRASPASSFEIVVGKLVPPLGVALLQLVVLFAVGFLAFDLRINGSPVALSLVGFASVVSLISFGVMITALTRTSQQLNALGGAGGMIFATFGGAFIPHSLMPGWAQPVAPATPTYWAMRGFRAVILEGGGAGRVLLSVAVLLLFAGGFAAVALTKFRFEETKVYYG